MAQASSEQSLAELGRKLEEQLEAGASKDSVLKSLKSLSLVLGQVDQSAPEGTVHAIDGCKKVLFRQELVTHKNRDVRLLVAASASEIMRIEAPNVPYDDATLKTFFELVVGAFNGLDEMKGPSYDKRVHILETFFDVKSCLLMLDLDFEGDDLVLKMFRTFFLKARSEHPPNVLSMMLGIMVMVVNESDDVSNTLVVEILLNFKTKDTPAAKLAADLLRETSAKIGSTVLSRLTLVHEGRVEEPPKEPKEPREHYLALKDYYYDIIFGVYCSAPGLLLAFLSMLKEELLDNNPDVRLKTVQLFGKFFTVPEQSIPKEFRELVPEFVGRFKDTNHKVRVEAMEAAKQCLLCIDSGPDVTKLAEGLETRLHDPDEACRTKAVSLLCEVAMSNPKSVSKTILESVANRLRDNKLNVRGVALEKLRELYTAFCGRSSVTFAPDSPDWIPAKILRAVASRMHRLQAVDIFTEQLFPADLSLEERAKRWIAIFYHFEKTDEKMDLRVFERNLLLHKQRFQSEMKTYLHLRQKAKEEDSNSAEVTKKIQACFSAIALTFPETSKPREQLEKLDHMKDPLVFKRLQTLLNPATSYSEARTTCDELLSGLGKHPQSEFLRTVALRCSYLLFGREHVVSVLKTLKTLKSTGNKEAISAGMSLLVEFSGFFPELMEGVEEDIVALLKEEEDDDVKEKALYILAKAGSFLRNGLSDSRSSLDLMLETYCLEGTRKQAKHAVTAIAALSSDSGLKSLSVLYGRLLTRLNEGHHLPTLLQSLGCIAQIATSVFETREKDVVGFLLEDLLLREPSASSSKSDWDSRSEDCLLKIYGVKALVKSFLPNKDTHLRQGSLINFLPVLLKLLKFGSIKETTSASDVDKAHLRLTAAKAVLRLSTKLEKALSVEVFRHAVFTVQDPFLQVRKGFLSKAYQYLKPQHLAPKYATVYPLCCTDTVKEIVEDSKRYMTDFVNTRREVATELQNQPEFVLTYLVHLLAHHAKFPDLSSEAAAYEPFYRIMFSYLQALLVQAGDVRKEVGNVPAVFKIFRSIKSTEDAEDAAKTQNVHVLCDIGLHIAKELAAKRSTEGYKAPVQLPLSFYSDIPEATAKEDGSDLPSVLTQAVLGGFYSSLTETSAQRKRMKKVEDTSADEADDDDPPPKKSRKTESTSKSKGRKVNREVEEGATNMSEDETEDASQKRKRGRPSKEKPDTQSEEVAPKKRGRPKGSASKKAKLEAESSADEKVDTPKVRQEHNQKTRSGDSAKKSEKQELTDVASTGKRRKSSGGDKVPVRKEETEEEEDDEDEPEPLTGRRVKVWWPKDKRFYAGHVHSYNSKTKKHRIVYDDGDKETLLMKKERWEYIDDKEETSPSPPRESARSKKKSSVSVRDDEAQGSVQKKSSAKKRDVKKEASDDAQHHSENHAGRPYSKGSKVNVNGGEAESSQSKGTDTDDDEPLESYRSRMKKKSSSSSKE